LLKKLRIEDKTDLKSHFKHALLVGHTSSETYWHLFGWKVLCTFKKKIQVLDSAVGFSEPEGLSSPLCP